MSGVFLWGYDATTGDWRKVLVDANGKVIISDADPFTITQATPENLKHTPHGYYAGGPSYLPYAVDANGKLLITLSSLAHLGDIDDVDLTGLADGDFIYYDSAAGTWARVAHADATTGVHGVGGSVVASLADIRAAFSLGSYTGDSSVNRAIPHGLGFIPKLIFIHNSTANEPWHEFDGIVTNAIWYLSPAASGFLGVTAMDAANFYVGNATNYSNSANLNTISYYWVAMG